MKKTNISARRAKLFTTACTVVLGLDNTRKLPRPQWRLVSGLRDSAASRSSQRNQHQPQRRRTLGTFPEGAALQLSLETCGAIRTNVNNKFPAHVFAMHAMRLGEV